MNIIMSQHPNYPLPSHQLLIFNSPFTLLSEKSYFKNNCVNDLIIIHGWKTDFLEVKFFKARAFIMVSPRLSQYDLNLTIFQPYLPHSSPLPTTYLCFPLSFTHTHTHAHTDTHTLAFWYLLDCSISICLPSPNLESIYFLPYPFSLPTDPSSVSIQMCSLHEGFPQQPHFRGTVCRKKWLDQCQVNDWFNIILGNHSFKYFLSTHYVSGTILGSYCTAVKKRGTLINDLYPQWCL